MFNEEKNPLARLITLAVCILCFSFNAKSQIPAKKYPSLLWEITGNGLSKPSYLFGTMHVSSKLVFNLPDSFYYGIKQAQVVALENNPELWQEEMDKYNFSNLGDMGFGGMDNVSTNEYLNISDLQFKPFTKKLAWAVSSTPIVLNSLLYRSYGMTSNDFEEDTYLDMYIYQIGKKLQKKITGVEDFKKSMQMTTEASIDMMTEQNKKSRSYSMDEDFSFSKLSEAYRTGNLDWLDTINKVNSRSDAYDEKFLYLRNDIQANSIDSIIKSGTSLFVGVGAAHLPGQRGVIEQLRRKGYTLRPVSWGERSSTEKDRIDNIRIPVNFSMQTAPDNFYTVKTPGKLFASKNRATNIFGLQSQFADMGNGSYYVVTRVQTNAAIMGFSNKQVEQKLDSLLYENVPGKIISKVAVTNNGYRGIDVTNKTRRGDVQRFRIYITPFEVVMFKMSGVGDYITKGTEADIFFNSIALKPLKNNAWSNYTPTVGGFTISLPGEPVQFISKNNTIFGIADSSENVQYAIVRNDINNYGFVGEDTVDLNLLHESFRNSDFITKTVQSQKTFLNGYPIMDAQYQDKTNNTYQCRYIVQGPHYYALIAHYAKPSKKVEGFFNSFKLKPLVMGNEQTYSDSSLSFSVKTTYFPKDQLKDNDLLQTIMNKYKQMAVKLDDKEYDTSRQNIKIWEGVFESKSYHNDTTGENILVTYSTPARYYFDKDSISFKRTVYGDKKMEDSSWIVREKKIDSLPNNVYTRSTIYTSKNSSRTLLTKVFYKNGVTHTLMSESDTLGSHSSFVSHFFVSFAPIYEPDPVAFEPFQKKSKIFFQDYFSPDSVVHKRALRFLQTINLDKDDFSDIKKAIAQLSWKKDKKYMTKKALWLSKIGTFSSPEAINYLKTAYVAATDTTELQTAILSSLLSQKTKQSFNTYKDIVANDPPVVVNSNNYSNVVKSNSDLGNIYDVETIHSYDEIMGGLYDSLQLTKTIYPELLPLINLDDYKWKVMELTTKLLDSNQINSSDYKVYFPKFLLEGKQALKKELAMERKSVIDAASHSENMYDEFVPKVNDRSNQELSTYAQLLLPFYDSNEKVRDFFKQLLQSSNKSIQLETYIMLLKSGKKVDDTLTNYFAENDNYRFKLYEELDKLDKLDKFPSKFNTHLLLAKSELLSMDNNYNGKPDSIVYIGEQNTSVKDKSGFVYFFKYKLKKDDFRWKIASAGLTPVNPKQYRFSDEDNTKDKGKVKARGKINGVMLRYHAYLPKNFNVYAYSLTGYSNNSIKSDEDLAEQLDKVLTRLQIEKQKSGEFFYMNTNDYSYGLGF